MSAPRKILLDSLDVRDGRLCLSYHVENLFNKKMLQGLESGFTSDIIHQISLWKSQKVISSIVDETLLTVKVYFDDWESKYAIVTEKEKRLTTQINKVKEMCSIISVLPLADSISIEPDTKYYLTIQLKVQPISTEKYQELRQWISGGSDPPKSTTRTKRNRFFEMLIDVMGFGDKTLAFKSKSFYIQDGNIQFIKQ
ncbi:hypothetical protein JW935_26120 [candidate division KSB1 bacterium]|nr:hypothetical protein [candidate division KSB1 bacterium]